MPLPQRRQPVSFFWSPVYVTSTQTGWQRKNNYQLTSALPEYYKMKKMLITGSSGLIGSEVCEYFHSSGWQIHGIDNNQREIFFGPAGSTRWNLNRLIKTLKNFIPYEVDIRNRQAVLELVKVIKPGAIIHAAAQPSHDRAAEIPFEDFETNAVGTLNLLEATRRFVPESPFVYFSTNKVYGDAPNRIKMRELETRWEYTDETFYYGIPENFPIDQSKHSLFGASKIAGDIMVQEYGRYFGIPTTCLRGGCLTGPKHSGVQLHGFLSYLVKCNVQREKYYIFGYKGKQVRDNIHASDVIRFIEEYLKSPRIAEVYNLGGGKGNTCSILEAFSLVESYTGKSMIYEYLDQNRSGDHICYYSDLRKIESHYPDWRITRSLPEIIKEMADYEIKVKHGS